MSVNVDTEAAAKLFKEHFETPFTEAMDRDLWAFNFFGRKQMVGHSVQWKIHYPNWTTATPTGDLIALANKGTSFEENEELTKVNRQAYIEAEVFAKHNYVGVQVGKITQAATKDAKAAYMKAMAEEGKEALEDLKNAIASQIESDLATNSANQATGAGNSNLDIDGFRGIILKGQGSGNFYGGLSLDTYPFLKPYVLHNSGTDRALTLTLMQQIRAEMEKPSRSGAKISDVLTARAHFDQYGNILSDYRRWTGSETMDGGIEKLNFGGTAVQSIPGLAAGEMWFIDKRDWNYYTLINMDTQTQPTKTYSDHYVVVHSGQLVCKHPGRSAAIVDLLTT